MILANKKMMHYLDNSAEAIPFELGGLTFKNIGGGYFFERVVSSNLRVVVNFYASELDFDWSGLEYSTNKIHLEDDIEAPISDVVIFGIALARHLVQSFKAIFPNESPVFWVGCDEFSEYPSVTLGFYVKRYGMLPLLPEDEASLESFQGAILILS